MKISTVVRSALHKHSNDLLSKKNVVGVATGEQWKSGQKTGREAVLVLVEKKLKKELLTDQDLVPSTVDGVPTDVIEVGKIKAQFRAKHRPVVPGTSVGHKSVTAGTLGLLVKKGGHTYILSNNHVLANANNAQLGDEIVQPGRADGGRLERDLVAHLSHFVPIDFNGDNVVDAALAKLDGDLEPPKVEEPPPPEKEERDTLERVVNFLKRLLSLRWVLKLLGWDDDDDIERVEKKVVDRVVVGSGDNQPLGMATPITKRVEPADVGEKVQKSGRTTGYTQGEIIGTNAVVNVSYGSAGTARFVNQILTNNMSAGGDSGSAVFDMNGNMVGLLFAGSDTVTIMNHADDVFKMLDIEEIA